MDPEEVRGRVQVFLMKERIKKYRAQQKVYDVRLFLEEHRNYDPRSRWWEDYPEHRSPESGKTQPRDDKGKYKKYVDSENGLTSGENSGTIKHKDIEIGRSLGAKAKNYDVIDLDTGEHFHFEEGTRLQDVETFAGKGTNTPYRKAQKYSQRYGGKPEDWQHTKAKGTIDYYGEERRAEVHFPQCEGIGKFEFFVKEWLE